jgi:hypothetical protein
MGLQEQAFAPLQYDLSVATDEVLLDASGSYPVLVLRLSSIAFDGVGAYNLIDGTKL